MKKDKHGDRCLECGGQLESGSYTHEEQVGRWKVSDGTGMRPKCTKCGEVSLSLDDLEAYQRRAARTALLEGKLEGDVLRYARKSMGLTQKELAVVLGYQPERISKWETGAERFDQSIALAVAGILFSADSKKPSQMVAEAVRRTEEHEPETVHTLRVPEPRLLKVG